MIYQTTHLHNYIDSGNDSRCLVEKKIGVFQTPIKLVDESAVLLEYAVRIPRGYAREENTTWLRPEDVKNVPHYELRIERQEGSHKTRRNTYIFLKLPKSGRYVSIILYPDGGASFDPKFHTWIIRELDELDRRIVLGFCIMYDSALRGMCHTDDERSRDWIEREAATYKASDMPKRLKPGPKGNKLYPYDDLTPIEESSLFSSIQLA